jgi:antitoxin (DNA-binding transcriptional repressor) of toxin-antitoxin stability system
MNALDSKIKLDMMSDMKKITAREFQKRFGQIAGSLKPGQAVEITMRGKPIGQFTKARKLKWPDIVSLLEKHPYPKELGNQVLKEFHDSLS